MIGKMPECDMCEDIACEICPYLSKESKERLIRNTINQKRVE